MLGIKPSASADEVKKAYKSKALETHPDKVDKTKVDAVAADVPRFVSSPVWTISMMF